MEVVELAREASPGSSHCLNGLASLSKQNKERKTLLPSLEPPAGHNKISEGCMPPKRLMAFALKAGL